MSPSATLEDHSQMTVTSTEADTDENHIHGAQGLTPLQAICHGNVTLSGIGKA